MKSRTAKLGHGYCLNSYVTDESFCRDVRVNLRHVKSVPRVYIYIYGRDREDNEPCALNGIGCGVWLPRGKRCFRSFLLGERG